MPAHSSVHVPRANINRVSALRGKEGGPYMSFCNNQKRPSFPALTVCRQPTPQVKGCWSTSLSPGPNSQLSTPGPHSQSSRPSSEPQNSNKQPRMPHPPSICLIHSSACQHNLCPSTNLHPEGGNHVGKQFQVHNKTDRKVEQSPVFPPDPPEPPPL